jgi:Family of unknown function (DUF6186)
MTSRGLTYAGFALLLALAIGFEAFIRRQPGLPTLGHVLTRRLGVRIAVLAFWAFVGWHLFVRGSGAFE